MQDKTEEKLPIIKVRELKKYFTKGKSVLRAVDGVNFEIARGETLGLVGESGCGKTTLGRSLIRIQSVTGGEVLYRDENIENLKGSRLRELRKKLQFIFQDPYSSLNPRMTIFKSVKAPLDAFKIGTEQERRERVEKLLSYVGLNESQINKYPHEMSGGQRQRAVIARAMIIEPEFIVCDEPVSALDVSVRAQVLNLMKKMQKDYNLSYLFISHDMSVVRYLCDRVMVMYLGKIVEKAGKESLFEKPLHPYTKALFSAIPVPAVAPDGERKKKELLYGDVPNPMDIPTGCRFRTRCPFACEQCARSEPELKEISKGHFVACHLAGKEGKEV